MTGFFFPFVRSFCSFCSFVRSFIAVALILHEPWNIRSGKFIGKFVPSFFWWPCIVCVATVTVHGWMNGRSVGRTFDAVIYALCFYTLRWKISTKLSIVHHIWCVVSKVDGSVVIFSLFQLIYSLLHSLLPHTQRERNSTVRMLT